MVLANVELPPTAAQQVPTDPQIRARISGSSYELLRVLDVMCLLESNVMTAFWR